MADKEKLFLDLIEGVAALKLKKCQIIDHGPNLT
jgi:hypothetical protein